MVKIHEVIVVEGKSDTNRLQLAVEADTIETNGSALSESTLQMIEHAMEKRGVIIFTDPDYAGKRIRHLILQRIPGCKEAFLPKQKAQPKQTHQSVGIEHASLEDLRQALSLVTEAAEARVQSNITKEDLIARGLIGGPSARYKRECIGELLHIGYANGKQLKRRLEMFQIQLSTLDAALLKLEGQSK